MPCLTRATSAELSYSAKTGLDFRPTINQFGSKRGGPVMRLQPCPYCPANVRAGRLQKHVLCVHGAARLVSGSSHKKGRQAKGTPLARQRASKAKSGFCTTQCSFCGLKQKSPRKRLECKQCGRTDNNPLIVQITDQQTEAPRKPVPKAQQPPAVRPSQSMTPPAVKPVPVPRTKGKSRRCEGLPSYGYGSIAAAEPWVDNVGPDGWKLHGG